MKFEEAIKLLWEECVEANCWNLYASCDLPYINAEDRDFKFNDVKKLKEKILKDIDDIITFPYRVWEDKQVELVKEIIKKRFGF